MSESRTTLTSAGLDVGGHSELDYVNVSAAATIAGAIDGNGGATFSGGETVISSATSFCKFLSIAGHAASLGQ